MPSLQNPTALIGGAPPRLTVKDIRQRAEAFRTLARQVSDFAVEIGALQPGPPPEFRAQLLEPDADSSDTE